jgi:hypothetical protein
MNVKSGEFEECANPCPTPESLYQLCDEDFVYETFRGYFDVQAQLAIMGASDANLGLLQRVADALKERTDFRTVESTANTAGRLLQVCALKSSEFVLDKVKSFTRDAGKQLMILLTFSAVATPDVQKACLGQPRFDQSFVDYLTENEFTFVDALTAHVRDFSFFRCSPDEYVHRYYISHYSPKGNHFFAFAIKDAVVEWLDPKPLAYQEIVPPETGPEAYHA